MRVRSDLPWTPRERSIGFFQVIPSSSDQETAAVGLTMFCVAPVEIPTPVEKLKSARATRSRFGKSATGLDSIRYSCGAPSSVKFVSSTKASVPPCVSPISHLPKAGWPPVPRQRQLRMPPLSDQRSFHCWLPRLISQVQSGDESTQNFLPA